MGRKNNALAVQERLAAVESQLLTGRWTRHVADQLAATFSVSRRQILHDRARIITEVKESNPGNREGRRAMLLMELRTYRGELAALSLTGDRAAADATVRLFDLEVKILGLSEPETIDVNVDLSLGTDPLALAQSVIEGLPFVLEILGLTPETLAASLAASTSLIIDTESIRQGESNG